MPAPMVTGCVPWKTAVSAIVAVASALRGALGGPVGVEGEEERWVLGGGLRVAIVCWSGEVELVKFVVGVKSRGDEFGKSSRPEE